jgi:hypothetical protein
VRRLERRRNPEVTDDKDRTTPCVITDSAINYAKRTGLIDSSSADLEDCKLVESVRKLMALGLSAEEIEDLDIRQPMLQAICEYARLDETDGHPGERAADAVDTTLHVIDDQIHNLDLEIEMLNLRKKALKRRTRVLGKLARSLSSGDRGMLAA